MTPKERVPNIINGKPTDRIAVHHIQFSGHAASIILGRKAYVGGVYLQWHEIQALWNGPGTHKEFDAKCERDAVDLAKACGHDILRLEYWRWPKEEKPVKKIDEFTFLFSDPDARWSDDFPFNIP